MAINFCSTVVLLLTVGVQLNLGEDTYAQIVGTGNGHYVAEYVWYVDDILQRIELSKLSDDEDFSNSVLSEEFYLGKPGYKVRLSLSPYRNNSKDGDSYVGLWMTLVNGKYDDIVEWPFQHEYNLTLIDQYKLSEEDESEVVISINPLTSICRLLEQFNQPLGPKKPDDGCGKEYFVPHSKLFSNPIYMIDGSIAIRLTVSLNSRGDSPKIAQVKMRGHELVSEFYWKIPDIEEKIAAVRYQETDSIKSDLFYVNSESYLMILHLLINSRDQQIGLYATIMPGDYDDDLEWPFLYTYEISIIDQSPGYFTSDRKGFVTPATGSCPLSSFIRPKLVPASPCGFRKIMDFKKLKTRNYIKNGDMIVKLTVILDKLPKFGAVSVHDGYLVSEHYWSIPYIDRKVELGKSGKLTNLLSDKFYTNSQGYLMQLQLRLQDSKHGHIGLFLSILEGEYDNMVEWPFKKKFSLSIIDQQSNGTKQDSTIIVNPKESTVISHACRGSFWRPFGRNDGCGSSAMMTYDALNTRKYIRYGSMLIKVRVYQEKIKTKKMATAIIKDNYLASDFLWKVENIEDKIQDAGAGKLEFVDSESFYLTNNGYRMVIRLYPSKDGSLGLFAALVKGEHDNLLEWPFRYKYQLSIVDQNSKNVRKDIVHTTYVNTVHAGCPLKAFDRPQSDIAELSCGERHLVSHSVLRTFEFIRNNAILLRLTVFMKKLLPSIASLSFRNHQLVSDYSWFLENAKLNIDTLRFKTVRRLESPLFYTANQGYAIKLILVMSTSIYPNGIGLYLTFVQGKYDSALQWPFYNTVNISLVDQTSGGLEITRTINPSETKCPAMTFEKPIGFHKNRLCGFPSIISLDELESFIVDDQLIFRVSVIQS